MDAPKSKIYSATYSNVPVYEYNVEGNHVMRRRSDNWINATHILKVAGCDKPARTRILEREVQKGVHEKVQGGYGKYQGTWISLDNGKALAHRMNCLNKLLPLLDYQPGERSPPPAPKHLTAQTSRPKAARNMAPPRRAPVAPPTRMSEASYDAYNAQMNNDDAFDQATVNSESDAEYGTKHPWPTQSRKRKRGAEQPSHQPYHMSQEDQQHLMFSDDLLDYFVLQQNDETAVKPPTIPDGININRMVDEQGHTALHWAAAMGDLHLVQEILHRGADINKLTINGTTPLMHMVRFTNNFDRQTFTRIVEFFFTTAGQRDCMGATVFHYLAYLTEGKSKYDIARYYLNELTQRLKAEYGPATVAELLNQSDEKGETATLIAAKYGARRFVRQCLDCGADFNIPNAQGETAEKYIRELNERRKDRHRQLSSSPPPANEAGYANGMPNGLSMSQTRQQKYASEAASLLSSQLPNLLGVRAEALAAQYDGDLAERENESREGERLLELRRQELSTMRKQAMSFSAQDQDDVAISVEEQDLQGIINNSRRYLDEEQHMEFKQLVNKYKRAKGSHPDGPVSDQAAAMAWKAKIDLARQLLELQTKRRGLVDEVITAQGLANKPDERHDIYKQLIMSALSINPEDVEKVIPEILNELEEGRVHPGERVAEGNDAPMADADTAPVRMAMPANTATMRDGQMVYAPVQVAS